MTRPLLPLSAADPTVVAFALRAALAGDGPAILPYLGDAPVGLPAEVYRRIALVVETSGSSGKPKRVALSSNALLASAAASDSTLGGPGQWLLALPVHYIAGLNVLVRSIAAETEPAVLTGDHFTAADFVETAAGMERGLRHYTSLVPVQLARLVAAAETDSAVAGALRRFDRLLVGGQSTPTPLLDRADALGLSVSRSYGSSETAGGCVYDGRALGGVAVRLRNGQIELGGPTLAEGYLGDDARTAESFVTDEHAARWYRTGDGGEMITVGGHSVLSVTGRLDRVIISGGVKVSLDAVERVLHALPEWSDALAVSQPDLEWGERVVIVGTARTNTELVGDALVTALGRAAAPIRFLMVNDIPRLSSGKPDRQAVQALVLG